MARGARTRETLRGGTPGPPLGGGVDHERPPQGRRLKEMSRDCRAPNNRTALSRGIGLPNRVGFGLSPLSRAGTRAGGRMRMSGLAGAPRRRPRLISFPEGYTCRLGRKPGSRPWLVGLLYARVRARCRVVGADPGRRSRPVKGSARAGRRVLAPWGDREPCGPVAGDPPATARMSPGHSQEYEVHGPELTAHASLGFGSSQLGLLSAEVEHHVKVAVLCHFIRPLDASSMCPCREPRAPLRRRSQRARGRTAS